MKFREKTKLGGVANTEEEGDWFKRISPGWEGGSAGVESTRVSVPHSAFDTCVWGGLHDHFSSRGCTFLILN